jgi:hypothetical protein
LLMDGILLILAAMLTAPDRTIAEVARRARDQGWPGAS